MNRSLPWQWSEVECSAAHECVCVCFDCQPRDLLDPEQQFRDSSMQAESC